jgi:muramoyltetrapeptide carboxypeptidase LdcA involved in peptidoglycan recycling
MSQINSMLATGSNIPLHCNVCVKKPNFSDVSHLLTHIASKGHLSAYYKMNLSDDPDDKETIEEYDAWYAAWHVEELMKERLDQKQKKKLGVDGRANSPSTSRRGSAGKADQYL